MGRHLALPYPVRSTPKRGQPGEGKMPLISICNRLVVTSTRWNTPLPSLGLSPCRPLQPASPFHPSLRPSFQARPSTAMSIDRCRPARPWVATQLTLRLQLLPVPSPRKATRCPELVARGGIVRHAQTRCPGSLAPPVASRTPSRHPELGLEKPGPSSRAARQGCTRFAGPRRLPPTGPISLAPSLRLKRDRLGRH
jgi:hypothetical protein